MGSITEIIEESKVHLEITEPGGGQIEVVDNYSTSLEIIESGSFINPTTLDIIPQTNVIVVDSTTENTFIDVLVSQPSTVETSTTNNVIEIVEDQVTYQTGSIYHITNVTNENITREVSEYITQNLTQSITHSVTNITQNTIQNITQSITQSGNDFTSTQISGLLNLIFQEGTISLSTTHNTFEKNTPTNITFDYAVVLNDDVVSSATFDGVDITSNPNNNQVYNDILSTISKTYSIIFTSTPNGAVSRTLSHTKTSTSIEPQYYGVSSTTDFNGFTYSDLDAGLTKKIQSGDSISQTVSPTNQYIYFLSTNNNATITDGNGFNNTLSFNKTNITVSYANGTNQTLYQYRSSDTKTLTSFTYNIT